MPPSCKRIIEPCGILRGSAYTVKEMSISTGPMGTLETLRVMAALSKEAVQFKDFCDFMANMLCGDKIQFLDATSIDRYLRSMYRYQNEDVETLYSPAYNVWQMKQSGFLTGDCDDISMLYAAVFHALGYRSRFVAMRTKPRDENYYHVVVEVDTTPLGWKRFDATVPPETMHVYYGRMEVYV